MSYNINDDMPTIIGANKPHMACVLLLDTSYSMEGEPLQKLNDAVNRFKEEVCEDRRTREILDIAIVEFNGSPRVVQNFVPIENMEPINLLPGGGTLMAPAIEMAIQMVDERSRFYRRFTTPYKPWIVMVSDGYGGDVTEIAKKIQEYDEQGKLRFFALGVGEYDGNILHQLAGKRVMKLEGYNFSDFFDWMNKSMRAVSVSSPGERPVLDTLDNHPAVSVDDPSQWG